MPGPKNLPETYRNVLRLRAVRDFDNRPLSDPDLHAILEAGRWTGSSKNRQSWSVIVVTDPDQKERLAETGDFTDPLRRAPMAIALIQEGAGYEFDIGRLAQNVMLAAKAIGVATCPVTFHRHEEAARVLGIPDGKVCRYGVALGYPAAEIRRSQMSGRKPLNEFVHWNSY
ncbi:MAG TPA: nitroreductase [Acidimicrobiia bacterium]|nr:nitroreductase [Acidimicrobiia bacterium]